MPRKDPESRDAYNAAYRAAHKAEITAWREAHREEKAAYNAAYCAAHRAERAAYRAAHPEVDRAVKAQEDAAHPEKRIARNAVNQAVKMGRFPPANTMACHLCGNAQAQEWHHHNGYGPGHEMDVIAVCKQCHTEVHRKYSVQEI